MDLNSSLFVFCVAIEPREEGSEEERKPCVLYSYPKKDNFLLETEVMLVVLCNVMEDLTGKAAEASLLTCESGKQLQVKYHKEGHKIVIFVVKSQVLCDKTINSLFERIMHLIFVLYGSVENAFLRKKFHEKLNGIFSSAEEELISLSKSSSETILNLGFEYIPMHILPTLYQDSLNKILSDLESKHPEHEEFRTRDCCQRRKQFFLVGSCVFFNEYLICNHLCSRNLEDVYVYLKFNRLLSQQTSQQIILWREIHLTGNKTQNSVALGYVEQPSQCHLLVVYHRPYFLATLLQSPKSPLGKNTTSSSTSPLSPPPLYIERLKATLSQIQSTILCFNDSCMDDNKNDGKTKDLSFADQIASLFKSPINKQKKFCNLARNSTEYSKCADISNLTISPTCMVTPKENSRIPYHMNPKYSSNLTVSPNSSPYKFQMQSNAETSDFQHEITLQSQKHSEIKLNCLNLVNFTSLHSRYPCCYGVVAVLYLQASKDGMSTGIHINGCCDIYPDIKSDLTR